jgi:hypothetical protein
MGWRHDELSTILSITSNDAIDIKSLTVVKLGGNDIIVAI